MAEDFSKDVTSTEPSSPKPYTKKEKSKYQAFRSDEDDSSEMEEMETSEKPRRKVKKERTNTFKVKIKKAKGKKKEKDKEKEERKVKKKVKKISGSGDLSQGEYNEEPLHEPIFGVPIEVATERSCLPDGIPLPRIVRECIIYVEDSGLDGEGLYRLSGVKSKVDHLKQLYNEGRTVNLHEYDCTTVTSLLKLYLRELPSNILTTRLAPIFDSCVSMEDPNEQLQNYQLLINDLPCSNRTLLGWLFVHFQHVMDKTSETKMNIQNLSIVFSPTMSISHGVLNLLFTYSKELFPDIKIVRYEPPSEEKEMIMPETMEELQQLLLQNEEVLTDLHDRVNQGESEDASLTDELWERQRWSTQIKRKIKTLQKAEKQKQKSKESLEEGENKPIPESVPQPVNKEVEQVVTETVKEQSDSISRESATDESNKAVSVEDVTLTVGDVQEFENTGWKVEVVPSEEENMANATKFATFNEAKGNFFADFNETSDFADFSGSNEFIDNAEENTLPENAPAEVEVEDIEEECDEEWKQLFWEEKKLSIENEELQRLQQLLTRKIESEHLEISRLKDSLQEHKDSKQNDNSSSSSCSSRNSSASDGESSASMYGSSESEESNTELEVIVNELKEENNILQTKGQELLANIISERQSCAMIRAEIRLLRLTKAMVL